MALPFDTVSCSPLDDSAPCSGCGWKCGCYQCSSANNSRTWAECQCPCRFWVVVCFVVLAGFFVCFYIATVFRKTLLYSMASGAVAVAAALSALAAGTDQCGWPAFFSIALVFAFPCLYSCSYQLQAHRRRRGGLGVPYLTGSIPEEPPRRGGEVAMTASAPSKPADATVLMVFPDGDVMLGLEERGGPDAGKEGGKAGKGKRRGGRGQQEERGERGSGSSGLEGDEQAAAEDAGGS